MLAAVLGGCAAEPEATGKEAFEEHAGFGGVWLRSDVAEAFVATDPIPRVVVFRTVGGESVLNLGRETWNTGLRTWFLAPRQNKDSPKPSRQPAVVVRATGRSVEVLADPSKEAGLRTGMEVTLAEDRPVLTVRHFMENTSGSDRELAVWAIVALPRHGRTLLPFSAHLPADGPPKPFRTVMFFPVANPFDPAFAFGHFAMSIDLDPPRKKATKLGVRNPGGLIAWTDGRRVLASRVAFDPRGTYPEGGANITCYVSGGNNATDWAEIEHDGPLQTVPPGKRAWLEQTLTLGELPEDADLNDPDALLEAVVSAVEDEPE